MLRKEVTAGRREVQYVLLITHTLQTIDVRERALPPSNLYTFLEHRQVLVQD